MIRPIQPCDVDAVWPTIAGLIERACHRTGDVEDADNLRDRCKQPGAMLVLIDDGAVVFQRCGDVLHMTSLGAKGFIGRIPDLMPEWRRIAISIGCNRLSLKGRKGWKRLLAKYGFQPAANDYLEAPSWV